MFGKIISKPVVVAVLLIHIIMISGCNNQQGSMTGYTDKIVQGNQLSADTAVSINNEDIPYGSAESYDSTTVIDWNLSLSNGMQLTIYSYGKIGDTLFLNSSYYSDGDEPRNRIIKISSLTEISIFDMSDHLLYSYKYTLINDNQVAFTTTTLSDLFTAEYYTTDSLISIDFNYDGRIHHIDFAGWDELNRAKALYWDIYFKDRHFSISPEDQELVQRLVDLYNFLNVPSSFEDNQDAEAAGYLMQNTQFVEWCSRNIDWSNKECGRDCICAIAGILTLTCFFGVVVVCIPATGVSVACALAALLSSIFD